jgi:hypothetical protein
MTCFFAFVFVVCGALCLLRVYGLLLRFCLCGMCCASVWMTSWCVSWRIMLGCAEESQASGHCGGGTRRHRAIAGAVASGVVHVIMVYVYAMFRAPGIQSCRNGTASSQPLLTRSRQSSPPLPAQDMWVIRGCAAALIRRTNASVHLPSHIVLLLLLLKQRIFLPSLWSALATVVWRGRGGKGILQRRQFCPRRT